MCVDGFAIPRHLAVHEDSLGTLMCRV